jgi:hypothetical protein
MTFGSDEVGDDWLIPTVAQAFEPATRRLMVGIIAIDERIDGAGID